MSYTEGTWGSEGNELPNSSQSEFTFPYSTHFPPSPNSLLKAEDRLASLEWHPRGTYPIPIYFPARDGGIAGSSPRKERKEKASWPPRWNSVWEAQRAQGGGSSRQRSGAAPSPPLRWETLEIRRENVLEQTSCHWQQDWGKKGAPSLK